jgi:hypothetical protein
LFCIQTAENTMERKDARSGRRGPYTWGGATGPGTGSYIEVYVHFNGEPAHYARYHPLRLAGSLLIIQPQTVPFSIC